MRYFYEELVYNPDLLDYIQKNVSIIGIVDAYFKIHSKEHSPINKDVLLQIRINNYFFYNCCPFHYNGPNFFAFSVSEKKGLYYCYGCGFGGSVFEFVMDIYNIDINEATELLGSFVGIFKINQLNQKVKEIYDELIINYENKDKLIDKSEKKTIYLTKRVDKYLDNMNLDHLNFQKVANRLCCSEDFVEERYRKTEYYKQKQLILERQKALEKEYQYFN